MDEHRRGQEDVHVHGDAHGHAHAGHGREARGHKGHGHTHGTVSADPNALRVLLLSSAVLGGAAAAEIAVALISRSAAVLADGLHNLGDLSTTVALAGAFLLSRRAPTRRFP